MLRPLVQAAGVAFILNDRPDLAAELGCDGVHVGQDDASYAQARAALPGGIVGVTCHDSRHLAMEAGEAGADYVAFGAFFPTATKEPKTQADPDLLRWWAEMMTVPVVAIGGITVQNAPVLVEAGADFLAVSAGVCTMSSTSWSSHHTRRASRLASRLFSGDVEGSGEAEDSEGYTKHSLISAGQSTIAD